MHKRVSPATWIVILFSCAAVALAFWTPPKHGPDGNYYYGVALRLSQGRFAESVEGLFSPLLPWLMTPFITLGATIPAAFRIVNVTAFIMLLIFTLRICKAVGATQFQSAAIIFLSATQMLYSVVGLISSDLLAAAVYLAFVYALIRGVSVHWAYAAIALALSYYAKSLQLLIGLAVTGLWLLWQLRPARAPIGRSIKWTAGIMFTAILLCLPWIVILSRHYGQPIISAQQLRFNGTLGWEYSPAETPQEYFIKKTARASEGALSQQQTPRDPVSAYSAIFFLQLDRALTTLTKVGGSIFFTTEGAIVFFGLLLYFFVPVITSPARHHPHLLLYGCCTFQALIYLSIWGGNVRYYFPVLPLAHLLVVCGASDLVSRCGRLLDDLGFTYKNLIMKLAALAVAVVIAANVYVLATVGYEDFRSSSDDVAACIAEIPELKAGTGIISGALRDMYPGYVAYLLKRECWNSIDMRWEPQPQKLLHQLREQKVTQVIWRGPPPAQFAQAGLLSNTPRLCGGLETRILAVPQEGLPERP